MTKGCDEIVRRIGPLVDGALPPAEHAALQDHLGSCAACRTRRLLLIAQAEGLREALSARAGQASMDGFFAGVQARIEREAHRARPLELIAARGREAWQGRPRSLAFTAGLALAASFAAVLFLRPAPPSTLVANNELLRQAASIEAFEVDDQSSGAVLQLPGSHGPTTVLWVSDQPSRSARP